MQKKIEQLEGASATHSAELSAAPFSVCVVVKLSPLVVSAIALAAALCVEVPGALLLRGLRGRSVTVHICVLLAVMLLATLGLTIADARRRPVTASIVFGLTMMAGSGLALALQPAFADSLPSVAATAAAAVLTLLAGAAGGALAARVADRLEA